MRIISRGRLRESWERHPDSEEPVRSWYKIVEHAQRKAPEDVKRTFLTSDVLKHHRVVFDIRENRDRVVVRFHYNMGMARIRFIGTQREYDGIDADTI